MLEQMRAEIAAATLNRTERYKILVEDDPQMVAAIDLFPRASKLMSMATDDTSEETTPKGIKKGEQAAVGPGSTKHKR